MNVILEKFRSIKKGVTCCLDGKKIPSIDIAFAKCDTCSPQLCNRQYLAMLQQLQGLASPSRATFVLKAGKPKPFVVVSAKLEELLQQNSVKPSDFTYHITHPQMA